MAVMENGHGAFGELNILDEQVMPVLIATLVAMLIVFVLANRMRKRNK